VLGRWTDISTSVILGADLDAPPPSPVFAFSGEADMVFRDPKEMPEERGNLGLIGNEADKF
jgi:hypothetical protein